MRKKLANKKEIIFTILILFGGAALTVMSFCVYYLVNPLNTAILVVICIIDYLYNFFSSCMLFRFIQSEQFEKDKFLLLKAFSLSVGYIAAFIVVAALFLIWNSISNFFLNHILEITFYAIFTGPSLFLVAALFLLIIAGA